MSVPSTVTELLVPYIDDANQPAMTTNTITLEPNDVHFINNNVEIITKTLKDPINENVLHLPKTNNDVNDCEVPSTSKAQKYHDISVAEILPLPLRLKRKENKNILDSFDQSCQIYPKEISLALKIHQFSKCDNLPDHKKCGKVDSSDDEKENVEDLDEEYIFGIYCNKLYHWSQSKEL